MHTIDLLKGEGLPAKTTLGSVLVTAIIFVLPLLAGAVLAGMYSIDKTELDVMQRQIDHYKKTITESEPNVKRLREMEKQANTYTARLGEVQKCVVTYLQWTPVLIAVAKNMPDKMVINRVAVTSDESKYTGRRNTDPNKPLTIPIPQRKMTVELSGTGTEACTTFVQDYQNTLKAEQSLKPQLGNITYLMNAKTNENPAESFTMTFVLENQKENTKEISKK